MSTPVKRSSPLKPGTAACSEFERELDTLSSALIDGITEAAMSRHSIEEREVVIMTAFSSMFGFYARFLSERDNRSMGEAMALVQTKLEQIVNATLLNEFKTEGVHH